MCSEHIGHWRVSASLATPEFNTIVTVKCFERTFLHGECRCPSDIRIICGTCGDIPRPAESSFLPFTPGEEQGWVQRSISVSRSSVYTDSAEGLINICDLLRGW